jgi:hypothetical protein
MCVNCGVLHRRGKAPAAVRHAREGFAPVSQRGMDHGAGEIRPGFSGTRLAQLLRQSRPGCTRRTRQEYMMIRTIAAALAALLFVAFSASAAEEKEPTTTDAARKETAKDAKATRKSLKKAKKKAKKAAPADTSSSATPK